MKTIYFLLVIIVVWLPLTFCFGQKSGIIVTERSGVRGIVTCTETYQPSEISDTRHIDGYVKKEGTSHFVFPVGHKGVNRPFAAQADGTCGAYYQQDPGVSSIPGESLFPVADKAGTLAAVSNQEFWDIDGLNDTRITLTWNTNSGIAALTENRLNRLSIAGWNPDSQLWEKINSIVDNTGVDGTPVSFSSGSISTVEKIKPGRYSAYTFGAAEQAPTTSFQGKLELVTCGSIKGWVRDLNEPTASQMVDLLIDGNPQGSFPSNLVRKDLAEYGIPSGNYGFDITPPASLNDGLNHQISIRIKGSSFILTGASAILNCAYESKLQSFDCSGIKGSVSNKNNPSESVTLELINGAGEVVGTAGVNAGISSDETFFQYTLLIPETLKNGRPQQLAVRVKGTSFILPETSGSLTCKLPAYMGSFNSGNCKQITGWVWDKNAPNATVEIEIVENNLVLARSTANVFRQDVKNAGYGSGYYGFALDTPPALLDGKQHLVSIRPLNSKTFIGEPKTIICPLPPAYNGSIEIVDCNSIVGWVQDKNNPGSEIVIELMEGNTILTSLTANTFREDLSAAGLGTGKYGFIIKTPAAVRNGIAHNLNVRIKGTNFFLNALPKTLTCPPPPVYQGNFESVNCKTFSGWVWDKNSPGQTIAVELVEGAQVIASGVAQNFRADVKNAGFGTGNYGFSLKTPAVLLDGNQHSVRIRMKETGTFLGVMKTLTCPVSNAAARLAYEPDVIEGTVSQLGVAPNPAIELVTVEFNVTDPGPVSLSLTDLYGRVLWQKKLNEGQKWYCEKINTAHYQPGIYIIQLQAGDRLRYKRLAVVR